MANAKSQWNKKSDGKINAINKAKALYLPAKIGIIILFIVKIQMIRDLDDFFCGAGQEMAAIDVDATRYPCHRFMPWVANKPAPKENVNCQNAWKPESCAKCKLIPSCPTCAGYNWEINGDSGIRTTFHCEAHKLEVLASAKLAAMRLKNHKISELEKLTLSDKETVKRRIEAIFELVENGI